MAPSRTCLLGGASTAPDRLADAPRPVHEISFTYSLGTFQTMLFFWVPVRARPPVSPLRSESLFPIAFGIPGYQSYCFFKADILISVVQMKANLFSADPGVGVGGWDAWPSPLGEAPVGEILLYLVSAHCGWSFCTTLSLPLQTFLMWSLYFVVENNSFSFQIFFRWGRIRI